MPGNDAGVNSCVGEKARGAGGGLTLAALTRIEPRGRYYQRYLRPVPDASANEKRNGAAPGAAAATLASAAILRLVGP